MFQVRRFISARLEFSYVSRSNFLVILIKKLLIIVGTLFSSVEIVLLSTKVTLPELDPLSLKFKGLLDSFFVCYTFDVFIFGIF